MQEEGRDVKAVPAKWHRSHGPARERRNVRRAMRRGSSCMDALEEHRKLLYFCRSWKKVRFHPLMESRATFLFETPMKSVWTDPIGASSTMKMSMAVIYSSTG